MKDHLTIKALYDPSQEFKIIYLHPLSFFYLKTLFSFFNNLFFIFQFLIHHFYKILT